MSLTLHFHPFSSYCQKALIALYTNDTPFERVLVDFGDEASLARFTALWPMAKMPVLQDAARGLTIPEATIIIEYLDHRHPGATRFVPEDPDLAWRTRLQDRFYDLHVQDPMQKIVSDRLRPPDHRDPFGVDGARKRLRSACALVDRDMATRQWAVGDRFSLADCAAAPALFYADKVDPLGERFPHAARYLERLTRLPAFARALEEARPYASLFPL